MEAIRKIQTVIKGQISLELPSQFWGQQVEIIILPKPGEEKDYNTPKKSLRGCLNQYSDPSLISQERKAWQNAVNDKHDHS